MAVEKFATQVDAEVLVQLRAASVELNQSISALVTQALTDYLNKVRVRPAFRDAVDEVFTEHSELLTRLAK